MTTRQKAREQFEKYLDTQHTILFLDWDITKKERREACVEFFLDLFADLGLTEATEVLPDMARTNGSPGPLDPTTFHALS